MKETALQLGILFGMFVLFGTFTPAALPKSAPASATALPARIELPIRWGDMGAQLVRSGVIDKTKFDALYASEGGISEAERALAYSTTTGNLVITPGNSALMLNLLWAFGLANKNPILTEGEMADQRYGNTSNFASTGGWTIASGGAMAHYSAHALVPLTAGEQALVDRVSRNIYRPCCDNPTHFPDCNHGMAMLGLLELMAAGGASEQTMYRDALAIERLWFPEEYANIARYFGLHGGSIETTDPKVVLGKEYSSASGYGRILASLPPATEGGGASCGA
ncbi:MAG: hypothetical protein KGI73_03215 [Patescibacteria group bacterium]|nr:hypothetical protein [Patescibacteria group bacterium]